MEFRKLYQPGEAEQAVMRDLGTHAAADEGEATALRRIAAQAARDFDKLARTGLCTGVELRVDVTPDGQLFMGLELAALTPEKAELLSQMGNQAAARTSESVQGAGDPNVGRMATSTADSLSPAKPGSFGKRSRMKSARRLISRSAPPSSTASSSGASADATPPGAPAT